MKLTQKTVAGLVLPDGKAEAIFFDDDIAASASACAPADREHGSSNTSRGISSAA
jgi:hypothetical protein